MQARETMKAQYGNMITYHENADANANSSTRQSNTFKSNLNFGD